MRRRLDLGAALIGRPRLLILDEPTTGLDPRSRIGMWDVIRDLVREGTTLLLTTQYLEEADELADTIAVVDHGKIIARGTADELKSGLGGERIEVIVHRRDDLQRATGILAACGSGEVALDEHTRELTVHAEGGAKALVQVLRDLDDAGIAIDDIGLRRPTLDDVFLALTGHAAEEKPDDEAGEQARRRRREGGMSAAARATSLPAAPGRRERFASAANDSLLIGWRNLKRIPRIPELAIFAILQSIMFVLLFAFVFGGAIVIPGGGDYKSFLMPGIFAQTIVFAAGTTAIGMTDDVAKGIVDRFRSLPIAHSAVLTGRTFADVIYNAGILCVLMATGFVIGWRVDTGIGSLIAGFGLLLLFAYAMVWLGVFLGPERADGRGRAAGDLHRAVPDHVHLDGVRAARRAADVPPADRRVEPDQHAHELAAPAVGQPEPERRDEPRDHGADPGHARLGRRVHRGVRPARGAQVPVDQPLEAELAQHRGHAARRARAVRDRVLLGGRPLAQRPSAGRLRIGLEDRVVAEAARRPSGAVAMRPRHVPRRTSGSRPPRGPPSPGRASARTHT